MVAVGVFPGWSRLPEGSDKEQTCRFPDSNTQHCLCRTRVNERTFVLPTVSPALSSPNVSRSMFTTESSGKEQTYALAVCNTSTVCFERAFRRGLLPVFIPTRVLQSAATPRD